MLTMSSLWMLLAACVAAVDIYDEATRLDYKGNNQYYDDNIEEDSGLIKEEIPLNDLMMLKLINPMPNSISDGLRFRYRPVNEAENRLLGWANPGEMDLRIAMLKKRSAQNKTAKVGVKGIKVKPVIRQQPRWRIKRPPRLCLLKLCASMYYSYE